MKKSPSPSAIEIDPSERCLNDCSRSGEGDGIPEVSGDPESLLGHIPDESPHLRNGPVVEIPQSHCKMFLSHISMFNPTHTLIFVKQIINFNPIFKFILSSASC